MGYRSRPVLLTRSVLERIISGEVTLVFRRWLRPTVRAGGTLKTWLRQPTVTFKRNVRKRKELGLTESLEVGYGLSPRGRRLLEQLAR